MVEIIHVEASVGEIMIKAKDKAYKCAKILANECENTGDEFIDALTAAIAIRSLVDYFSSGTEHMATLAWKESEKLYEEMRR